MLWEHSILIEAPVERVWRLTVDVERWPSFIPTVRSVRRLDAGPLRIGSAARLKQPGQPPAVWTVTGIEPMRHFTWQSRRPGMTMTARHVLSPAGSGCRNTLTVEVTGAVSRPFGGLFGRAIQRTLERENAGFQRTAQERADTEPGG
jgi:uncharacterized membrane protein